MLDRMHDPAPPLPSRERLQELLFDAARIGRADMIRPLHAAGADLEERDGKGHTALILAAYHGHDAAVAVLVELGADVDAADAARGNTALMGVCFKGYEGTAQQLMAAGAEVDRTNEVGQTALMMASLFGHTAIAEKLVLQGANAAQTDLEGNSALSLAASQGNAEMLGLLSASPLHGAAGPAAGP